MVQVVDFYEQEALTAGLAWFLPKALCGALGGLADACGLALALMRLALRFARLPNC